MCYCQGLRIEAEGLPCLCSPDRKVVCVLCCMVSPQAILKVHYSPNLLASFVDALLLSATPQRAIGPSKSSSYRSPSSHSEERSFRKTSSQSCRTWSEVRIVPEIQNRADLKLFDLEALQGEGWPPADTRPALTMSCFRFCFSVAKCEVHE